MAASGHDENWVDEEATKTIGLCPICTCVPRDAVAHVCGNLFCEACWNSWHTRGNTCSLCREQSNASPAHKDRRAVLNLTLLCPLLCGEIITLAHKSEHLQIQCQNRTILCSKCSKETTPATQVHHAQFECEYREIRCPLCNAQSTPINLPRHQEAECSHRIIDCHICGEQCRQADLQDHIDRDAVKHVLLLMVENQDLKNENQDLKDENKALKAEIELMKNPSPTSLPHSGSDLPQFGTSSSQTTRWHPGRIGAIPNGIGRTDGQEIMWASAVAEGKVRGYSWHNFRAGWRGPVGGAFEGKVCGGPARWTCCNQVWDADPCATMP